MRQEADPTALMSKAGMDDNCNAYSPWPIVAPLTFHIARTPFALLIPPACSVVVAPLRTIDVEASAQAGCDCKCFANERVEVDAVASIMVLSTVSFVIRRMPGVVRDQPACLRAHSLVYCSDSEEMTNARGDFFRLVQRFRRFS